MVHLHSWISQEVVQLFRGKFNWGTKRDFVYCLKNDALNLRSTFQFIYLETGQKSPSMLLSSSQLRQSSILFLLSNEFETALAPLLYTDNFCYSYLTPWNQDYTFIIVLIYTFFIHWEFGQFSILTVRCSKPWKLLLKVNECSSSSKAPHIHSVEAFSFKDR